MIDKQTDIVIVLRDGYVTDIKVVDARLSNLKFTVVDHDLISLNDHNQIEVVSPSEVVNIDDFNKTLIEEYSTDLEHGTPEIVTGKLKIR